MALKDYTLKFTDDSITSKTDIGVSENSVNSDSTSLTLYGYGHKDYGTGLWENMLHIMENFCSSNEAPAHPTIGQLWYNAGKKSLFIYVGMDDTSSNHGWKNIVTNYDFSNTVGGADAVVQYLTKSDLVGYLTPEVSQQLIGDLVLKNNDSWYKTVDGVVRLDTGANIPGNYAASVRYVNVKVDTVVTEKITTALTAATTNTGSSSNSAVTADSVALLLSSYDTTGSPVGSNHLYIRRSKNSPDESRTMYANLILPEQSTAIISGDDNIAATKGYVRAVLSASTSTISSSSTTSSGNYLPTSGGTLTGNLVLVPQSSAIVTGDENYAATKGFVRAVVNAAKGSFNSSSSSSTTTYEDYLPTSGGTLTGGLYLTDDESGYTDTDKNRAATRAYVDAKVGTGNTNTSNTNTTTNTNTTNTTTTDIISPANKDFTAADKLNNKDRELISYTKLPDGTLIVYGYYRNFGVSYKDNGKYASSLTKITFPDGLKFTNNYYAVSITEDVPTVTLSPTSPPGTKTPEQATTYKSCDNLRRSGLWKDFKTKYPGFYQFRGATILNDESKLKLTYLPSKYNQPVSENYNVANTSLWDKHWTEMSKVATGSDFTAIAPTTFSVFEKEQDGFRLSAYNDNGGGAGAGLTYLFWRNFIACNFTAIGRWK